MKRAFLLCAVLLLSANAWAADEVEAHRFSVSVGGFWPDVDTNVRLDGNGGRVGTEFDFESDLGLDDRKALFTGSMSYRLGKRHSIELLYFRLARNGERTLDVDISWGDEDFQSQESVDSFFDTDIYRLSYGYAFIDNDRHQLVGQFGVHYTKVSAGLRRDAANAITVEADTDVPLPVIGLRYDYGFTDKLSMSLRGQIFRLEFEEVDGALDNLSAILNYAFTSRFGAFLGYNYYKLDVDAEAERWNGSFEFGYHGPWVGFTAGFGRAP